MDKKISVIIPAYNIEYFLANAVDSILAQTYRNIEVVIVNDGSVDKTGEIADDYAARFANVKAVHQENGGVTAARLRGVAEASCEWIGFVDGDDEIEPEMYQRLIQNAETHRADISHCGYQMVFPDGRIDYYYNTGRVLQQEGTRGCHDLLAGQFVEPGLWNKLYRRKLFDGLSEWMDQSIKINEDLLMNYYLFRRAKVSVFDDFCPYHYLLRKGSAATGALNENKLCDPLKVLHLILADAQAELQPVVLTRLTRLLIERATMNYGKQYAFAAAYREEARKELRQRLKSILTVEGFGLKLKIMALWAAAWPGSYGWVHRVYGAISGTDKKYDLG